MKKYDVVALGEALFDYIPQDGKVCGQYRASVGGAPLNVSIGIAKLSGNTALIARVGDDPLGYTIIRTLQEKKVNTSLIQIDRSRNTPVTIVFPDSSDMQRYIIYRKDGSDSALVLDEISGEVFDQTYVLHTGALLSTTKKSAETVCTIIRKAKEHNVIISLDVNVRIGCWDNRQDLITRTKELMDLADIIKLTSEEVDLLQTDVARYPDKVLLVTNGDQDVHMYWNHQHIVKGVERVKVVDSTGAGDAFFSAFLYNYVSYLKNGTVICQNEIEKCLEAAILAGKKTVQMVGAW